MRRIETLGLSLVALALRIAHGAEDPKAVEPSPSAPAGECLAWTSPQGKPYWYRLPKKLKASDPAALVIMLHGTGMNHGWPFFNYPLVGGAWRKDDVILAPEGMTPGDGGSFNFVQGEADGEQIAALIQLFRKKLPIDRVYLYGHSQGAFFCYWFAGEHPELIDGIVAHAGNVLAVKHPKLAKEKVAIGILHGRADAVVPVDCADRTEKVYLDAGYRKVRKRIVEGLTEQSGHWPLPQEVAEMLAWLDSVSAPSAAQSLAVATDQLGRTENAPDLGIVREAVENGEKLLAKAKGDAKASLGEKLAAIRSALEQAAAAHAASLLSDPALADAALPYGAWAAHFRAADAAFGPLAAWQKPLAKPRALAQKHAKAAESALKSIGSGADAKAGAIKAARSAVGETYLAAAYADLLGVATRLAAAPPKGAPEKEVDALRALLAARSETETAGREAAAKATTEFVAKLRAEHPELFAAAPDGG